MARLRTWHVIPLAVLAVAAGLPAAAAAAAKTYTITAATPGAYHYLCPVPGARPERHDRAVHRQ